MSENVQQLSEVLNGVVGGAVSANKVNSNEEIVEKILKEIPIMHSRNIISDANHAFITKPQIRSTEINSSIKTTAVSAYEYETAIADASRSVFNAAFNSALLERSLFSKEEHNNKQKFAVHVSNLGQSNLTLSMLHEQMSEVNIAITEKKKEIKVEQFKLKELCQQRRKLIGRSNDENQMSEKASKRLRQIKLMRYLTIQLIVTSNTSLRDHPKLIDMLYKLREPLDCN